MVFKNKSNEQIANITNEVLVKKYEEDDNWVKQTNYIDKDVKTIDIKIEERKNAIKNRLIKLSEDIIQYLIGEKVPNIEERKKEFILLHNELRKLEDKSVREC